MRKTLTPAPKSEFKMSPSYCCFFSSPSQISQDRELAPANLFLCPGSRRPLLGLPFSHSLLLWCVEEEQRTSTHSQHVSAVLRKWWNASTGNTGSAIAPSSSPKQCQNNDPEYSSSTQALLMVLCLPVGTPLTLDMKGLQLSELALQTVQYQSILQSCFAGKTSSVQIRDYLWVLS